MLCDRARDLVPVYLDGELSEELAAPLRRHLMECTQCRGVVAETKSLSSWFVPGPAVPVPEGFAARVVRRALAGDPGLLVPVAPPAAASQADGVRRFAMNLAALAAVALLTITVLLSSEGAKSFEGEGLQAGPSIDATLERLEALNRAELAAIGAARERAQGSAPNATTADPGATTADPSAPAAESSAPAAEAAAPRER